MTEGKVNISVIVPTANEEHNIADCLESVSWADEIIVVDARSADRTVEIAGRYTKMIFVREWSGYAEVKQFALQKASHDWVLWLDADERVTPPLAAELVAVVRSPRSSYRAYEVPRRAYFLGKWIRHSGWYPGYVIRLFQRRMATFTSNRVHEKVVVHGPVGRLSSDLLHYTDDTIYHYLRKMNRYTSLAAEDALAAGKSFSLSHLLVRPPYQFLRMYFLRLGFLDGMHGLILALLSSGHVFTKYAKLWDTERMRNAAR